MEPDAWLTLATVALLLAGLVRNWAPPDVLLVASVVVLALAGVITPAQAFAGFANPGMLTVAMLFIVAAALQDTGVLDAVSRGLLGKARSARGVLARLAAVVVPFSAFLNNTPVVAMFMPVVLDWCRRRRVSPSRLLIPLSYFAILGGTLTLIGTSTNLVVNGLLVERGFEPLGLFEITKAGLPYAAIGLAYILLFSRRLLPERKELLEQLGETRREYMAEMLVEPGCRLVGQTVEDAGLRQLPGLFLAEIERAAPRDEAETARVLSPVSPDAVIQSGDRLVFAGIVSSILELERIPGLTPVSDPEFHAENRTKRNRRICEAVISGSSPLVGVSVRDNDFRTRYGAAVLAVHRGGHRVESKIGDIVLRAGDTLLLQTQSHFMRAHRNDPAFFLVSNVDDFRPLRHDRRWIATGLFVALVVLMATGLLDTLLASALIAVLMVGLGCIAPADARRSIDWQTLVVIAASFGVGLALEKSGAAAFVAALLVDSTSDLGPAFALSVLYLACAVVTEMITNNAAAVLVFPFALQVAELLGVSPMPFVMAVMLAASASFTTPIGYQTNMMVFGPGGYRFTDFVRFGGPLNVLLWLTASFLLPLVWPF